MKLTYLGHNAFIIETGNTTMVMDPFFMGEVSLPDKIDYLLLTHAHGDHIKDAEDILKSHNPTLIANYEVSEYYNAKGYQVIHMNHGADKDFDWGNLRLTNAIHSSSFPDGSYGGNPVGFVLTCADGVVYFAGDTALTMDMQLIPLTCKPLDLAVLPIGNTFTMGYQDATIASDFIKCNKVLGCHYNTFPPIEIDTAAAQAYFADKGKELILLDTGASINLS